MRHIFGFCLALAALLAVFQTSELALYAFPHADDFCHWADLKQFQMERVLPTVWALTKESYLRWNSRWPTVALHFLVKYRLQPFTQYPLPLLIFAGLRLLGLIAFCWGVLRLNAQHSLITGLILQAVLLIGMPALSESHYWLTSVIEYEFPLTCGLFLFAALARLSLNRKWVAVICPAVLVVACQHEFLGAALIANLGCVCLVKWLRHETDKVLWSILLCAALVGFASLILAPGTHSRSQLEPQKLPLMAALKFATQQAVANYARWLFSPALRLGSLVWVGWLRTWKPPAWLQDVPAKLFAPLLTLLLPLMAVCAAPLMAGYQAGRSLNWAFQVSALGLVLSLSAWRERVCDAIPSPALAHVATLALCCALYFAPNVELARRGLGVPLREWRATMTQRYQVGNDGVLPAVTLPSPLLPSSGVLESGHWLNKCVARFLGVPAVIPAEPCKPND